MKKTKKISLFYSVFPILILVVLLSINVFTYGDASLDGSNQFILLIGGFQTWNKTLDVGTYSFLVFITQRLLWPLTTLGHVLDDFQRSMASIDRVIDLIDTPIKIKDGKIKIEPKDIKGEIIFNNVNFNYPGRDSTLKNINFKVENNSTLGIVGLTGSGKSTIIKLLLRIYDSKNGSITLDGVSIKEINLKNFLFALSLWIIALVFSYLIINFFI